MRRDVVMPDLGTSPVVLSVWYADVGDLLYEGDRLVEVLAAGAVFDIAAPTTGRLIEKRALPDDVVTPGQVLGVEEE